LGGPISESVTKFCQQVGYDLNTATANCDHLGHELEVMAFLCQLEAVAEETDVRPDIERISRWQRSFLETHLLRWLPATLIAVQQHESRFFAILTEFTLDLVPSWREHPTFCAIKTQDSKK
jgi:TorA maturation chaperone TorD